MGKLPQIRRTLFTAAMLGVLGFGAASVFAEPTQAAETAVRGCVHRACSQGCKDAGHTGGFCNYMDMSCECFD